MKNLIIGIIILMTMMSCEKTEVIIPSGKLKDIKKCMGCLPINNKIDTIKYQ